ncbi:hypothetical protein LG201_05030 [Methylobacillus gramineus]|uniref:hypothetical protein n=1 Tax=Methylobacillus gramineus TaxID=755169 RepID=UPI001CFF9028|nr:hypothetical protein [Methylobacillus gramineus]MCB5184562.1 hypothetical protein [Methylobacillus gramineus]
MDPFHLIGRYFWAICLVFSLFNYLTARRRLNSTITARTEQAAIAKSYHQWFPIAGAIPWLVMGFGQIIGHTPSIWYYFRPQDFNPYVIAWLASVFLLSILFAVWVFAADGARKTREFELLSAIGIGMRSKKPIPEALIKLLAALGPVFLLLWVYLAVSMNAPTPPNVL